MGEIFRILSEFYKFPSLEFYEAFVEGEIWCDLQEAMKAAALPLNSLEALRTVSFANYEEMKRAYSRTFIGIGCEAAVPVESVYKAWTTDESSSMSFASSKGYLMGDSALHIQYILSQLQMELPDELSQQPDHIAVLLELLGYFIDWKSAQETSEFLKDHFDWLEDFKRQILKVRGHDLYLHSTQMLIDLVERLQRTIADRSLGSLC